MINSRVEIMNRAKDVMAALERDAKGDKRRTVHEWLKKRKRKEIESKQHGENGGK